MNDPARPTVSDIVALTEELRAYPWSGRLIVIEGPDGAGKTDLVAGLKDALRTARREVIALREPGGTILGERLRAMLKDPDMTIDPRAEALMFAAARAQIIAEQIRPALDRGAWVLLDRYIDSSVIYQGIARDLGENEVRALSDFARDGLEVDMTLVLQVDPDVAAARVGGRGLGGDRMENTIDMQLVRDSYRTITDRNPRAVNVDANGTREQVLAGALAALAPLLTHAAGG